MIIRRVLLFALFSSTAYADPSPEPSPEPAPAPEPSPEPAPQDGAVEDLLEGVGGLVGNLLEELLGGGGGGYQPAVDTVDISLDFAYCNQPLFVTFLTKTEAHCLIDNICFTYFPLPDDPFTYNVYSSTVFADGSLRIETSVVTDLSLGRFRAASPFCTYTSNIIGYAGCDTYVDFRQMEFGECVDNSGCPTIVGISSRCVPLGLSCIDKVEEIVCHAGLTLPDFVILPMKRPPQCVMEQICVNNIQGNFYRALNLPLPAPPAYII